jgi:hypothetical protein
MVATVRVENLRDMLGFNTNNIVDLINTLNLAAKL